MNRRLFHALLGATLLGKARPLMAQKATKVPRIGWLGFQSQDSPEVRGVITAFWQGMKEQGFVENRDVVIEYRWAEGSLDRIPGLARELVGLGVDLIVAANMAAVHACRNVTKTIPILCFNLGDPVGEKLAASLARPGGNVTGLAILAPEMPPKQLSLLKEAVPGTRRIAALMQPGLLTEAGTAAMVENTQAAAQASGIDLRFYTVRNVADVDGALAAIGKDAPDALLLMPSPISLFQRQKIGVFISARRLPTMGWIREFVPVGALMSYGVDFNNQYRRGASYVVRVLKGADPGTLPIEEPTKFELVVNLGTAQVLGLTIPPSILARADEVIE